MGASFGPGAIAFGDGAASVSAHSGNAPSRGAVTFTAEVSNRRGPRPSVLPMGGYEDAKVVAADLAPSWRQMLLDTPPGEFPRFGLLKVAKAFDSAIRRGFIEPCGYVHEGQWQYRLTFYGEAIKRALAGGDLPVVALAEEAPASLGCGRCGREEPGACAYPSCPRRDSGIETRQGEDRNGLRAKHESPGAAQRQSPKSPVNSIPDGPTSPVRSPAASDPRGGATVPPSHDEPLADERPRDHV